MLQLELLEWNVPVGGIISLLSWQQKIIYENAIKLDL